MNKGDMVTAAKQTAVQFNLIPSLVCAIVEQESAWDPLAMRLEEVFFQKYIRPKLEAGTLKPAEAALRCVSLGLMQPILESLREIGYVGDFDSLADPVSNLNWGCRLFVRKTEAHPGDPSGALEAWNGGSNPNYAKEVLARISNYQ